MSVRTVQAWALPGGVSLPPVRNLSAAAPLIDRLDCDAGWMRQVAAALVGEGPRMAGRRARDVARVLGGVGARFLDESDPLRAEALRLLPGTAGISPGVAAAILDGMARDWTPDRLLELLDAELGDPAALDGFVRSGPRSLMAVGPRLCTQIVSGSVVGVGVTALIRSLLVKSPTLLKPGLGDVVLPVLFARALREADPSLADALAVVYWPGGDVDVEGAATAASDVVVVYGRDETVRAVRDRVPVSARFVGYRNRISVGVVGRKTLDGQAAGAAAHAIADAVAVFDQRGCVSPQLIFVECGGRLSPADFAVLVGTALAACEDALPSGPLSAADSSALHQARGTLELLAASEPDITVHFGSSGTWTVVLAPETATLPVCPGRSIRIEPIAELSDLPGRLTSLGPHLQSIGVSDEQDIGQDVAETLARTGVTRIVSFRGMPFPPAWWRHDGRGGLEVLLRWTESEP